MNAPAKREPLTFQPAIRSDPHTMSSREIADLTGSTHDNVLKTVRGLIRKGVVSGNETPYVHPQNGQTYKEVLLDYRNTMVVVSGYSVELRAKIIDRWQELERRERPALPDLNNPATLRLLLADYANDKIALEEQVAELAPKADALDRIATADGSMCITDAAKTLQVQPKAAFQFLRAHRWIYSRQGGGDIAYQDKLASGLLEHKTTTIHRSDGSEKVTTQVRVTPKGLARLAKELQPVARAA